MGLISRLIELKYENAKSCAGEIESIAANVKRVADVDISEMLAATDAAWDGDASVLCCRKIGGLQTDVKNTGIAIERGAGVARTIAENVHRAEQITYQIAIKRWI